MISIQRDWILKEGGQLDGWMDGMRIAMGVDRQWETRRDLHSLSGFKWLLAIHTTRTRHTQRVSFSLLLSFPSLYSLSSCSLCLWVGLILLVHQIPSLATTRVQCVSECVEWASISIRARVYVFMWVCVSVPLAVLILCVHMQGDGEKLPDVSSLPAHHLYNFF